MALGAVTAGLAASPASLESVVVVAGLVTLALVALRVPALALLAAGLLIAGAALGAVRLATLDAPRSELRSGALVEAPAVLLARPRPSRFGSSAEIELLSGEARGARLAAHAPRELAWPGDASPGMELSATGSIRWPRARPGAAFDYPAHLRRRGIAAELALDEVRATGGRRAGAMGVVDGMRDRAEEALAAGVEPPQAALVRGIVLGQDEGIDPTVRDDFRRAGLAHLLAVSGQNVTLLGLLALPLLAAAGLGVRGRVVALLALIAVYVPLAGAGPSLQRAGVMGAAGLVAITAGRPASRSYALLLAAAATLALNPRVLGDPGWQLSFAAVVGILLLGPGLRRALGALPRPVAEGVALTVAATLATAPLLAHHFGAVSLAALPANVLALPVVAPVMWIGMAQVALGQIGAAGAPLGAGGMAAASVLGWVNGPLLGYLEWIARWFAELPGAQLELPPSSPLRAAGAYLVLGLAALGARRTARRVGPTTTALLGRWRTAPRGRRWLIALAVLGPLIIVAWRVASPPPPPDRLTVSFLDVGQGDATLVQHPDGAAVLFDGGPEEARVARLLREEGVRRLGAVVATHASTDHHGGLEEVLERFPVDLLLDGGDATEDPDFRAMLAEADHQGVRRVPAQAGQTLRLGGLSVRILSPTPRPPGPVPEDPNPRAVAAVVSAGTFDLFLSGDAESPSLTPLDLPDVEAMKVSHHGSADPGLPDVLARLRPQVAAIEVGEDNGYGHPTPSTLAALDDADARVYRTDQDGTVTLTVEAGGLEVSTER